MCNQVFNGHARPPLLRLQGASAGYGNTTLLRDLTLTIAPGLTAVTGDEGSGKTLLLRLLAGELPAMWATLADLDALWLDPQLPGQDQQTPEEVWYAMRQSRAGWDEHLRRELSDALGLTEHLGKPLFMLSTGSRRKVGLLALLASGARLTCIDQPYVALDMASVRVLREFFNDMADHPSRAWVVADYEADAALNWGSVVTLQAP